MLVACNLTASSDLPMEQRFCLFVILVNVVVKLGPGTSAPKKMDNVASPLKSIYL